MKKETTYQNKNLELAIQTIKTLPEEKINDFLLNVNLKDRDSLTTIFKNFNENLLLENYLNKWDVSEIISFIPYLFKISYQQGFYDLAYELLNTGIENNFDILSVNDLFSIDILSEINYFTHPTPYEPQKIINFINKSKKLIENNIKKGNIELVKSNLNHFKICHFLTFLDLKSIQQSHKEIKNIYEYFFKLNPNSLMSLSFDNEIISYLEDKKYLNKDNVQNIYSVTHSQLVNLFNNEMNLKFFKKYNLGSFLLKHSSYNAHFNQENIFNIIHNKNDSLTNFTSIFFKDNDTISISYEDYFSNIKEIFNFNKTEFSLFSNIFGQIFYGLDSIPNLNYNQKNINLSNIKKLLQHLLPETKSTEVIISKKLLECLINDIPNSSLPVNKI